MLNPDEPFVGSILKKIVYLGHILINKRDEIVEYNVMKDELIQKNRKQIFVHILYFVFKYTLNSVLL